MIGRRDNDSIDCLVFQQAAKIGVTLNGPANELRRRFHPRRESFRHRHDPAIWLRQKVSRMRSADQPGADQADADALVRAHHAVPRGGAERGSRSTRLQELSAIEIDHYLVTTFAVLEYPESATALVTRTAQDRRVQK